MKIILFSRLRYGILVAAVVAGSLAAADPAKAELVDHHGVKVEATKGRLCIACHDGVASKEARYCTSQCDASKAHAVFRPYPPIGKERSYAPLGEAVARGIAFENGLVTCISCHDVRNPGSHHLVVPRGVKLCVACHIE